MKVVADTNTYISGLLFKGQPKELLSKAINGEIDLYISPPIFDETMAVLARDKFKRSASDREHAATLIRSATQMVEPKAGVDAVKADPTDNRVIDCALEAHADFIVSGDKHLLKMKEYAGIPIVTVRDFLTRVLSR